MFNSGISVQIIAVIRADVHRLSRVYMYRVSSGDARVITRYSVDPYYSYVYTYLCKSNLVVSTRAVVTSLLHLAIIYSSITFAFIYLMSLFSHNTFFFFFK